MSYNGNITVYDDDSNVVFERELSSDEIIKVILEQSQPVADEPEEEENELTLPAKRKGGRLCSNCQKPGHTARTCTERQPVGKKAANGAGCEECGSKGKRHKNGCPRAGAAKVAREVPATPKQPHTREKPRNVGNGRLLTEDEFQIVKELRKGPFPKTSMQILAELPDDIGIQHINWAILCADYDKYVWQAEHAA
jgi:Zinc knuckle